MYPFIFIGFLEPSVYRGLQLFFLKYKRSFWNLTKMGLFAPCFLGLNSCPLIGLISNFIRMLILLAISILYLSFKPFH